MLGLHVLEPSGQSCVCVLELNHAPEVNEVCKALEDKGRPLPKFGEWDVNDPASAERFTVIYYKARDEKKTGGKPESPAKNQPTSRSEWSPPSLSLINIYVNPPIAPPLVGGYGYGVPFYGGWGWLPFSYFAPGPGVAVGVGVGFDLLVVFIVMGAICHGVTLGPQGDARKRCISVPKGVANVLPKQHFPLNVVKRELKMLPEWYGDVWSIWV